VSKSIGALVAGAYQVKDNTGTLTVVSEGNSPPPEGSKLTVKGIFQSLVTLGSKSLAVLREESRQTHSNPRPGGRVGRASLSRCPFSARRHSSSCCSFLPARATG